MGQVTDGTLAHLGVQAGHYRDSGQESAGIAAFYDELSQQTPERIAGELGEGLLGVLQISSVSRGTNAILFGSDGIAGAGSSERGTAQKEGTVSKYPASGQAVNFVLPSYEWAVQRLDSINNRIQVLAGFSATLTLGVLALAVPNGADFESWLFWAAMIDFATLLIVAAGVHYYGELKLINPRILREKWLHKEPETFHADLLFFAGAHFEKNIGLVNLKGVGHLVLTLLFCIEIALLAAWLVVSS